MDLVPSHRLPRLTLALVAIALAALLVGGIAAAGEASAKPHGKPQHGKQRKKTRHGKQKKHRIHRTAATSGPIGVAPVTSVQEEKRPSPSAAPPAAHTDAPKPTYAPPPPPAPSPPTSVTVPGTTAAPSSTPQLSSGSNLRSFWLNQSAPGAITEVPDPAGSGETVFKFTVGDGDLTQGSTPNPRGELISKPNITAGAEFWWSTKFFLPADFPAATPNFVTLMQGPYGSPNAGTPPFHIEANNGVIKWQRNSTYNWDIPWEMPQVRNQWVSVMIHERFAADGWIEMWINGQQVTFFANSSYNPNRMPPTTRLQMATMDSSNNGGPNALYLQQYRKAGMYSSLTTYEGPLLIGPTRESVGG